MTKKHLLIFICLFSANFVLAQNVEDSLRKAYESAQEDSTKFRVGRKLFLYLYDESAMFKMKAAVDTLLALSKRKNDDLYLGITYGYLGDYYGKMQRRDLLMQNYLISKSYLEKTKSYKDIADLYSGFGIHYSEIGKIKEAIYYFKKHAALYEDHQINDVTKITNNYNNLGVCAATLGNNNLAKFYFRNNLKIWLEKRDSLNMGFAYNNLAEVFMNEGRLDSASYYYQLSLNLKLKFETRDRIARTYWSMAILASKQKNPSLEMKYLKEAEKYVDSNNYKIRGYIYTQFARAYHQAGDNKQAYAYQQKYSALLEEKLYEIDDSNINRVEKAYTDSLINDAKNEITQLKIQNQNEQIKQDKMQKIVLGIGLFLVLIGGVLFYNRYQVTKKQKEIIERQKVLVEEKSIEISSQRDLLEEKQKEIIDSINYAHRIQSAVMAGDSVWKNISREYFIVFKPKDIVSGDFYWAYNTSEKSIWAAADCTGHGVPGAFMSMLGNSFLNQIVIENKITNPADILNSLRLKIIEALEKEGVSHNDGMDISLCVWNKSTQLLEFAAANNSAIVVRGDELMELKADKMPIGKYHGDLISFKKTELVLQENDTIYMYTDGYADQFGGPKGKKFRYKPLDEMLLKSAVLPTSQQKQILEETFLTWKGELIQTDDVCIIAVKVVT